MFCVYYVPGRSIVCIIIIINNITNTNKQDNNVNFSTMKNNDLSCEGLEINKTLLATREHYITAPATLIREPVNLLFLQICTIYHIYSSKYLQLSRLIFSFRKYKQTSSFLVKLREMLQILIRCFICNIVQTATHVAIKQGSVVELVIKLII